MVLNAAFLLNQVGYPAGGPQTGFVAESFRPALQPALNPLYVFRTEVRPAASTPRLPQSLLALLAHGGCPLTYRLTMGTYPPGHFRLAQSFLEKFCRLHTSPLQSFKISALSRWKSHAQHPSTEFREMSVYYAEVNNCKSEMVRASEGDYLCKSLGFNNYPALTA